MVGLLRAARTIRQGWRSSVGSLICRPHGVIQRRVDRFRGARVNPLRLAVLPGRQGVHELKAYICGSDPRVHLDVDIESAVARAVIGEGLSAESVDTIRREITRAMETLRAADRELRTVCGSS